MQKKRWTETAWRKSRKFTCTASVAVDEARRGHGAADAVRVAVFCVIIPVSRRRYFFSPGRFYHRGIKSGLVGMKDEGVVMLGLGLLFP